MEQAKEKSRLGKLAASCLVGLVSIAGLAGAMPEQAEAITYSRASNNILSLTKKIEHGTTRRSCVASYHVGLYGNIQYTPGNDYITVNMYPSGRAGNYNGLITTTTHYCSGCGTYSAFFVYEPPNRSSYAVTTAHASKEKEKFSVAHSDLLKFTNNRLIFGIASHTGHLNYPFTKSEQELGNTRWEARRRFLKGKYASQKTPQVSNTSTVKGVYSYNVSIDKNNVGGDPIIAYQGVRYAKGSNVITNTTNSAITASNFVSGMRIAPKVTINNSNSYVSAASGNIYNTSSNKATTYMEYGKGSATFTIKPNANYRITAVTGGTVQNNGASATVTISKLTANKTISVTTTALPYITSSVSTSPSGTGGTITASGYVGSYNGSKAFTATASTNYVLDKITVNDSTVWTAPNHTTTSYTYTVSNVTANKTIVAYFKKKPAVTATAGANGQITSPGSKIYEFYATPTYYITPSAGYRIHDVIVDGQHMGPISAYTFPFLATAVDHTISAEFAKYDMGRLDTGNLVPNYVENIPLGGITVQKALKDSANGNPESVKDLSGIEIGLFSDRACSIPAADSQTTDAYGKCTFKNLLSGTYYVKELSIPERLQNAMSMNTEPMEVVSGSKYVYKLVNDVTSMRLSITKSMSKESSANVNASLLMKKNEMLRGTRFAVYASEADAAADTNRVRAIDTNGNVTDSFATETAVPQTNGTIAYETGITGLPLGDYWIRELSVNDDGTGSWVVDPAPVKASELPGDAMAIAAKKDNTLHTGRIEISKAVSQDSVEDMLDVQKEQISDICEGVVYGVFESSSAATDGTAPVYSLIIENGNASVDNVPYGRYYIKELSAPASSIEKGLVVDTRIVAIDVTKDGMVLSETKESVEQAEFTDDIYLGAISIKKTDADTDEELEGIVFDVYEKNAQGNLSETPVCQLGPTDASGSASTGNVLLLGRDYEVIERIDSMPFAYTGVGEYPQDQVELWSETVTLTSGESADMSAELSATNKKLDLRGSIDLVKRSNTDASAEGAVFDVLDETGQSIGKLVTDANGYARMDNVPIGSYSVVESEPLENHSITSPDTVTQSTFAGEVHYNQTWHVSTQEDPIVNYQGYIKIRKSSSDPGLLEQAPEKYSLEGAEYTLYPIIDGNVSSNPLNTVLTTTADGTSETVAVPLGRYKVVETKEPDNYSTPQEMREFEVTVGEGNASIETALVVESVDNPIYNLLNFEISKKSLETNVVGIGGTPQSTTNLGGCCFAVRWSPVIYEQKSEAESMHAERTWVLVTNEDGYASFADGSMIAEQSSELFTDKDGNAVIPTGTVTIQEIHPPDGYELGEAPIQAFVFDGTVEGYKTLEDVQPMALTEDEGDAGASDEPDVDVVESADGVMDTAPMVEFANNIRRADIAFDKIFPRNLSRSMSNMGFVLSLLDEDGDAMESHLLITDENGHFSTASGTHTTANANDQWLPAEYAVNTGSGESDIDEPAEETVPDEDGSTDEDNGEEGDSSSGDADDNEAVPEGEGEGEADEGEGSESADEEEDDENLYADDFEQEAPSEEENLEEYKFPILPADAHYIDSRVWFSGGSVKVDEDPSKGALVYGTYELIELPREDTLSWQMIEPVTIVVGHDETGDFVEMNGIRLTPAPQEGQDNAIDNLNKELFDLGAIENHHIEITGTEALDSENGTHSISLSDCPIVIDTVWYEDATIGEPYTFNAYVYDITNGTENAQLLKAPGFNSETGEPIEMESVFTTTVPAEATSGKAEIRLYLEPFDIIGKTLAVKVEAQHDGYTASTHNEDLTDPNEMTYSPTVATSARDKDTSSNIGLSSGKVEIIDTVTYTNLVPGVEYTVRGTMMSKPSKTVLKDANGIPVTAEATFTPSERNGTIDVTFAFEVAPNTELNLVCFEELLVTGHKIAEHKDIDDAHQNVIYPSVSTTALDAATQEHTGNAEKSETVTVIDKVEYHGLIPNQEYELIGEIYVEDEQGNKTKDASLEKRTTFTPEQSDGYVEMSFEIPADKALGKAVTVAERILSAGKVVAVHDDPSSEDQSVSYPVISTKAFDVESQWNIGRIRQGIQLSDEVSATSLFIGQTYKIHGVLMDMETGSEVVDSNGQRIESETTFTAQQRDEVHHLLFQLPDDCQSKKIVVYEKLYTAEDKEVASHEDLGDFAQSVSYPVLSTKASDGVTSEHVGINNEEKKVIDVVSYDNLVPGVSYTIVGTLVNPSTGLPIETQDAAGNTMTFTANTDFTATSEQGDVTVEIPFSGYDMENKTTVVFERLYIHDKRINGGELTLVGEHVDAMDENQSVHYPSISTHATDQALLTSVGTSHIDGGIVDTVKYENLVPGHEYTITGKLVDANSGEELTMPAQLPEQNPDTGADSPQPSVDGNQPGEQQPADGNQTDSPAARQPITASTTFTPSELSGEVDVVFENLPGDILDNKKIVVFETLSLREFNITCHTDLNDQNQTVYYPSIQTSARDAKTETHEGLVEDTVKVVDTVTYENLLPGQEYTMSGTIMDKETGEPLVNADGNPITSTLTFTPEQESGSVELTFEIPGSIASGKHLVAFEQLLDASGNVLTVHEDIEDEEQTVSYPAIQTTAKAETTNGTQASFNEKMLIDEVRYQGLTMGKNYTLHAVLMDKESGEPVVTSDGTVVENTLDFVPASSNGSIEITLDIEKVDISGKTFVVFEELYDNESEKRPLVAQHKDIEDEAQTVHVPAIATTATDNEGKKEFYFRPDASIIDTVEYHNLIPGQQYKLVGTLMNKETGDTLSTSGLESNAATVFTPTEPNGTAIVEFKFNDENPVGYDLVAFEELYLIADGQASEGIAVGDDDVLVAEHRDINDEGQSVRIMSLSDIASDEVPLEEFYGGVLDEFILETKDGILYVILPIIGLSLVFMGIRRIIISRR